MTVETISWRNGKVILIDQTKLPLELVTLEIEDYKELGEAIRRLSVRGAPAIGIAGAFGVVLGLQNVDEVNTKEFIDAGQQIIDHLAGTRPTAVNLFWALDRMEHILKTGVHKSVHELKKALLHEALTIQEEDKKICRAIGKNGAEFIADDFTILTHCNAGALATADYGTALGVVYAAVEQGKKVHVFADETRPLLQGARLTTWELMQAGIDVTLICDNMAAFLMQQNKIHAVFVGADRIAANGDTANKIGTYNLAVLANYHHIPFYVAAPISTIDFDISEGKDIPIEERSPAEITSGFGHRTAPENIPVYNPAFDITPNRLISSIITERGSITPPYEIKLRQFKNNT